MAWTYSGNPGHSARDHVRFLIGDTDRDDQQLTDGELDHCITTAGSTKPYAAAVLACEALAARYSRQVSKSMGTTSIQAGERAKAYATLAATLAARGGARRARPRFGGASVSEHAAMLADGDLIRSPLQVDKPGINTTGCVTTGGDTQPERLE